MTASSQVVQVKASLSIRIGEYDQKIILVFALTLIMPQNKVINGG